MQTHLQRDGGSEPPVTKRASAGGRLVGRASRALRGTRRTLLLGVLWLGLLVLPSVGTVLRYTGDHLNADGVEQSMMSVQGPALFYWGQDRLVPVVSLLASPVSDPTANLWVCLTLQAVSLYGLLVFVAHRTVAALGRPGLGPTVLTYLVLAAAANSLFSSEMMQSFAVEGQPYALSWLLLGLSYEAWKAGGRGMAAASVVASFVAMGVNPSVVLLGAFLAVAEVVRRKQVLRWVAFCGALAVLFVLWAYLSNRFAMYPTPERSEPPSYFGFSADTLSTGLPRAIDNVVVNLRPIRTVVVGLAALLAVVLLRARTQAVLMSYGAFFVGFTALYVALFAGNEWVMLNGYVFRYFFPLPLALVLLTGLPIAAALLQVTETGLPRVPRGWLVPAVISLAAGGVVASMVGPVQPPEDARVFRGVGPTQAFARDNEVRFLAGAYWNMWPLALGLLDADRHAVFVAGFKSDGDREANRRVLDEQVDKSGVAKALCVNQAVSVCVTYLSYWTRPGWESTRTTCPAPPPIAPADTSGSTARKCKVLVYGPTR